MRPIIILWEMRIIYDIEKLHVVHCNEGGRSQKSRAGDPGNLSSTCKCTMVLAFACALGQHQAECSAVFEWDLYGVWRIKVEVNGDPGVLVLDTRYWVKPNSSQF